jgi:hypothetical protein
VQLAREHIKIQFQRRIIKRKRWGKQYPKIIIKVKTWIRNGKISKVSQVKAYFLIKIKP